MDDQNPTQTSQVDIPPFLHGWQSYKLPELATVGFPFAPTFIVRANVGQSSIALEDAEFPFGFRFRIRKEASSRPTIDLTKGYYDQHTQLYTIPLRDGGDTAGPTFLTGQWTAKGDGNDEETAYEWDLVDDQETD